jgi:ATP-binding cassette subfamily B protein
MAVEWTGGKESRIFGLGAWAIDRAQQQLLRMSRPKWSAGRRSVLEQWQIVAVVAPPLVAAFVLVVWQGAGSIARIGTVAGVLGASWAILNLLGFAEALEIEGAIPGNSAFRALRSELATEVTGDVPPATLQPGSCAPLVQFEAVSFTYPGTADRVLDGLDLEIRPGELLAIVGLNGAGKSTLIKLLAGLYRPSAGRITVDGVDLTSLSLDGWRGRLSVVFQDFVKYQLSAFENVTLGHAAVPADRSAAEAAATDAGLDRTLARLPLGWETPLARTRRDGVDLSGGQWQQVVLARALYALRCGARLLVLDEPTAHLDVRSEFEVFQRLADRKEQASVVLISHRLSTVRLADRIVLLDGGRIAECGTHAQLMGQGGFYAELFTTQARRFQQGFDDRLEAEDST